MIKNFFKVALRNMWRHKSFTLINAIGLTIGIAISLLILMWIKDEVSYDRFHADADRIYRVLWEARYGENEWKIPLGPVPVARTLQEEFPEVAQTTQLYAGGFTIVQENENIREKNVLFVDEHFADVFSVNYIAGDPKEALNAPDAVVLSASTAQRYFGEENPIGKTLLRNGDQLMRVTGVVEDFPAQSHMEFDFLAPLQTLSHIERRKEQWGSAAAYTYFLLQPESSVEALQAKFDDYIASNVAGEDYQEGDNYTAFPFQPLLDIHLKSHLEYELGNNGNITYVYIFGVIAAIILILACINFVNLATARSMTRAREVGIRKVLGSRRWQIRGQFFAETLIQVFLSVCIAVLIVELCLPIFNDFSGKELTIALTQSWQFWGLLLGLAAITTLLAGSFPAFFLSAFAPVKVLKGEVLKTGKRHLLREGLVIFQFSLSICLIIGTLVVRHQLHFLQHQRLGFDQDQVLVIDRASALGGQYQSFLDEVQNFTSVKKAAATQVMPGKIYDSTIFRPEQPANYQETSLSYSAVDHNFVDVLELNLVEGRNFSPDMATDSAAFLLNEAAAEKLGWDEPIGRKLTFGNGNPGPVIGVVENFHFRSLHHDVEPLVMMLSSWRMPNIAIKLQGGDMAQNIKDVKATWQRFFPKCSF